MHETLRDRKAGKVVQVKGDVAAGNKVVLNPYDRGDMFGKQLSEKDKFSHWLYSLHSPYSIPAISHDGLLCQCREHRAWHGCRSTQGVESGKHYFEATVTDEGLCRVGWSTAQGTLELGRHNHHCTIITINSYAAVHRCVCVCVCMCVYVCV